MQNQTRILELRKALSEKNQIPRGAIDLIANGGYRVVGRHACGCAISAYMVLRLANCLKT